MLASISGEVGRSIKEKKRKKERIDTSRLINFRVRTAHICLLWRKMTPGNVVTPADRDTGISRAEKGKVAVLLLLGKDAE